MFHKGTLVAAVQVTLLVIALVAHIGLQVGLVASDAQPDFAKFHASARYFLNGEDPYKPVPIEAFADWSPGDYLERFHHPNLNLPAAIMLLAPLGLLSFEAAFAAWNLISLICGLVACVIVANAFFQGKRRLRAVFWLWVLLLLYYPTLGNTALGQLGLVSLLLTVLVWRGTRGEGGWRAAGIALGFALTLKVFFVLIVMLLLLRRQWDVLRWASAIFAVLALGALALMGFDAYVRYFEIMDEVTWYANPWNASFLGVTTRLLGGSGNIPLRYLPELARLLAAGLSGLALAFCAVQAYCLRAGDRAGYDLVFAYCLTVMLIVSPLGWLYYFPILILSLVILWIRRPAGGRRVAVSIAVVGWAMSTLPVPLRAPELLYGSVELLTWGSAPFYALALLSGAAASAIHLHRFRAEEPALAELEEPGAEKVQQRGGVVQ